MDAGVRGVGGEAEWGGAEGVQERRAELVVARGRCWRTKSRNLITSRSACAKTSAVTGDGTVSVAAVRSILDRDASRRWRDPQSHRPGQPRARVCQRRI